MSVEVRVTVDVADGEVAVGGNVLVAVGVSDGIGESVIEGKMVGKTIVDVPGCTSVRMLSQPANIKAKPNQNTLKALLREISITNSLTSNKAAYALYDPTGGQQADDHPRSAHQ